MSNIVNLFELPKCEQQHYIKMGIKSIYDKYTFHIFHIISEEYDIMNSSAIWFDSDTLLLHHPTLPAIITNNNWCHYNQGRYHRLDGPYCGSGEEQGLSYAINGKIFHSKKEWEIERYLFEHPEVRAFT